MPQTAFGSRDIVNVGAQSVLMNSRNASGQCQEIGILALLNLIAPELPTVDPQVYGTCYRDPVANTILMSIGPNPYSASLDFSNPANSMYLLFF